MRPKEYEVLCMAVERGVRYGWNRAHKHVEHPGEELSIDETCRAVVDAICEWFDFETYEEEEE